MKRKTKVLLVFFLYVLMTSLVLFVRLSWWQYGVIYMVGIFGLAMFVGRMIEWAEGAER